MLTKELIENTKTVTISEEEYDEICEAQSKLLALEAAGVDNWSGYDFAMEILQEWDSLGAEEVEIHDE